MNKGVLWGFVIGIIIILFINYCIARKFEGIAFQKGYDDGAGSFRMCFWFGIVGILYVIALPDRNLAYMIRKIGSKIPRSEDQNASSLYKCPECGEPINRNTTECPWCGVTFDWSEN